MEPNTIKVPKAEMTDLGRANFATECAFAKLLEEATHLGMKLSPVMGLMYLPDQATTRQFQEACRAVLEALGSGKLSI